MSANSTITSPSPNPYVFFIDSMMGKLCRILRMLGYRCIYLSISSSLLNSSSLIHFIRNHNCNKVLVTRNKKRIDILLEDVKNMYNTSIDEVVLLPYTHLAEQIRSLSSVFGFSFSLSDTYPFCTICGGELKIIRKEALSEEKGKKIPLKVFAHQEYFYYCPYCDKYYWKGKHWDNVQTLLRAAQL